MPPPDRPNHAEAVRSIYEVQALAEEYLRRRGWNKVPGTTFWYQDDRSTPEHVFDALGVQAFIDGYVSDSRKLHRIPERVVVFLEEDRAREARERRLEEEARSLRRTELGMPLKIEDRE